MSFPVPHVTLSQERLSEVLAILTKGNTLLKECAAELGLDGRAFRTKLFNNQIPLTAKVVAAKPFIEAVRAVEMEVISHHVRMASGLAKKWARFNRDFAYDDFFQEALSAVLESVYAYTGETKFTTYATVAMNQRMRTFIKARDESYLIVQMQEQARSEMSRPATESEVSDYLGLNERERNLLSRATSRVTMGIDLKRAAIDKEESVSKLVGRKEEVEKLRDAIELANLSSLERLVIEQFMTADKNGWQSEIARTTINPRTQKNYTRQNISQTLIKAQEKIKRAYVCTIKAA
jgi:RNA polymerase sigma factor (sigma-70 family)